MIDAALGHVASQLNQSLKRSQLGGEDWVVLSNLAEPDGSATPHAQNKLAVYLVNIERETLPYRESPRGGGSERISIANAPVYLNLFVMFAANFGGTHYGEALKLISSTIAFFQAHPSFDRHGSPGLDSRIDRLTLEIENLSLSDLSNLWSISSGKYVPSVLYRMRMVVLDAAQINAQVPTVQQQPRIGALPA
jgi:Pvc16 N-terminal domain